jgi:hypothetical protein
MDTSKFGGWFKTNLSKNIRPHTRASPVDVVKVTFYFSLNYLIIIVLNIHFEFSTNNRYGITPLDIFRGINDTTNSALKAGLMLSSGRCPSEKGTTCFMHAQELVVKHALGLSIRKGRNGSADDTFDSGVNLRNRVKAWLSKIMDKKSKTRFNKYKDYCKSRLGIDVLRFKLPNETRVAGVYLMYQSALRSRKTLIQYSNNSAEAIQYNDIKLSELEWDQLAETYAILHIAHTLAMQSQQDSADSNCFSYFQVATARYAICKQPIIKMLDMTTMWDPCTEISKLPMIKKERRNLSDETVELIERFDKEFMRYFPKPDSDQLIMMVFHPVMVWMGFT